MELTYIYHSCFVLETTSSIVIFDYWRDPSDSIKRFVVPGNNKHIYVLASHFHEDHFNSEIFGWRESHPEGRLTYILSKDILKHHRAAKEQADVWLAKGGVWHDDNIGVTATGSNDSGVSWVIDIEGKRIFHAGDLCNWYARFLDDKATQTSAFSEEMGMMVSPLAEEKRFLGELKDIGKITDHFDLAMFPIDGRIGNGYTRGARQFISRFRVGILVPMHFVMSGFDSARRMAPYCQERGMDFWQISKESESIAVIGDVLVRHSTPDDIIAIRDIFSKARSFMVATGNPNQWTDNYPDQSVIEGDMSKGTSFVIVKSDEVVATFALCEGEEPTYQTIYNGAWTSSLPYATIHRVAGNGKLKGVFHVAMQYALMHHKNVRIDTHPDNTVMQRAIAKEGFVYCGIIHCQDNSERLAYEYSDNKETESR